GREWRLGLDAVQDRRVERTLDADAADLRAAQLLGEGADEAKNPARVRVFGRVAAPAVHVAENHGEPRGAAQVLAVEQGPYRTEYLEQRGRRRPGRIRRDDEPDVVARAWTAPGDVRQPDRGQRALVPAAQLVLDIGRQVVVAEQQRAAPPDRP